MVLINVTVVATNKPTNIVVDGKIITSISDDCIPANNSICLENAIAFPGLINSHDHLDFNCFEPLGNSIYQNYTQWGAHIHTAYKAEIQAVLSIPQHLRSEWGMYKNLLAGVTSVVNHGDHLPIKNPLINIYQNDQNLHSVKFEKKWKWKLNNPMLKNKPCIIHVGEGVDKQSHEEINKLLNWNLLSRKLIGVHGVAMYAEQAKQFLALIWCPESNRILLNKHADIKALKNNTNLVFGTDSTLTGDWNIWQHLRLAQSLQQANSKELFDMVTDAPAKVWQMNNGRLAPGKDADIVIAKMPVNGASYYNFFTINPDDILLVVQQGNIRLFDESLVNQLSALNVDLSKFSRINYKSSVKFVEGNLPGLIASIKRFNSNILFPCCPVKMVSNA